jgi:ABC-type branched-subunit amino acid transport system substrate-binding protein
MHPSAVLLLLAITSLPALAQPRYDPGATDTEIKIGNIMPYTGGFSEYGATGRAEAAYFRMINDAGGINTRKINFISLDSGSDTDRAVALAHQLVEQDRVLATVGHSLQYGDPPVHERAEGAPTLRRGHGIGV